jgi:hypothetical protein
LNSKAVYNYHFEEDSRKDMFVRDCKVRGRGGIHSKLKLGIKLI